MRYDPSKYETVDARLKRLFITNSKVSVHTEIVWNDDDFNKVCFKASLMEDGKVIATGFAMDWKSKDKGATTTNWVETSETSAIGRAIANSKYQDKNAERPSRQEMEIAATRNTVAAPTPVKQVSAPTPTPTPTPAPTPVKNIPSVKDRLLSVVGDNALAVNKFLLDRGKIKNGQTFLDVGDGYAKSIVEYPAKFLALAVATNASK
jgi:hypothetical protein